MEQSQATAANVRALMATQRVSGRELARRLGEPHSSVARRIAGGQSWTIDQLVEIATALNVDPASLLPLPGQESAA